MSSAFTESQVNKTNPNPYHQVVVLSQATINASFTDMWLDPSSSPKLRSFHFRNDPRRQWIDAQPGPPEVSIHVAERSTPVLVYFHMKFLGGRIQLPGRLGQPHIYRIDGWDLVFRISIKSKELHRDDPRAQIYKSQQGFKDGVFALAQLYLDVSSVGGYLKAFDEKKSHFGQTIFDKETMASLKDFMDRWPSKMEDTDHNIIGYSLVSQQPGTVNNTVPSFVPTTIDYYAYPWLDPARPTVATDGLEQNALCLLTMTGHQRPPPVGIAYSGAFVDRGATFCMNSTLFWAQWLLPLLQEVNQATQMVPQKQKGLLDVPAYTFGSNPRHRRPNDPYFGWHGQSDSKGNLSWTWKGERLGSRISRVYKNLSSEMTAHGVRYYRSSRIIQQTAISSTQVSFQPGGQKIFVKGNHNFDFQLNDPYPKKEIKVHGNVAWHLNFRLQSVKDGGLQIIRVPDPRPGDCCRTTVKSSQKAWGKDIERIFYNLGLQVSKYFSKSLGWLTNDLNKALQHQHKLFLPGAGAFAMRHPRFNKRGDLLADLEYIRVRLPRESQKFATDPQEPNNRSDIDAGEDVFRAIPALSDDYPSRQHLVDPEHLRVDIEAPKGLGHEDYEGDQEDGPPHGPLDITDEDDHGGFRQLHEELRRTEVTWHIDEEEGAEDDGRPHGPLDINDGDSDGYSNPHRQGAFGHTERTWGDKVDEDDGPPRGPLDITDDY